LQAKADPNLGSKGGWLPLHGAIYNDYDDVVALLLKAGAKTNEGVDEIKGYAPIHIAIASEQVCLVFFFTKNKNTHTTRLIWFSNKKQKCRPMSLLSKH
jgi:ankyrin repeat protein